MKQEKDLKVLMKLKQACNEAYNRGNEYIILVEKEPLSFNVATKTFKLAEWQTSLANLVDAILKSKEVFTYAETLWNELNSFSDQKIAPSLDLNFEEKADLRLIRVIKIARNYYEHSEKYNQTNYVLLADNIPIDILVELFNKAFKIISTEINSLSIREKEIMLGESLEIKRQVKELQKTLKNFLPLLEKHENYSSEMEKQMNSFLEFVPNKDNIVIDLNLPEQQI